MSIKLLLPPVPCTQGASAPRGSGRAPAPAAPDPVAIHSAGATLAALAGRQQVILEAFNEAYEELNAEFRKTAPMTREAREISDLIIEATRLNAKVACVTQMRLLAERLKDYAR